MTMPARLTQLSNDPTAVQIREWRYELQTTLLNSKKQPNEDQIRAIGKVFTALEGCEMTSDYLLFSKVDKVIRHIALLRLEAVPLDEELRIRERAAALAADWGVIYQTAEAADRLARCLPYYRIERDKFSGADEFWNVDEWLDAWMVRVLSKIKRY
ncbi:hypothetical protein C8R46DRAFT_1037695 [Mycena filopes]|nr:hypothetical protein C8R46DRAFT_1037695 [Mycena filopes]